MFIYATLLCILYYYTHIKYCKNVISNKLYIYILNKLYIDIYIYIYIYIFIYTQYIIYIYIYIYIYV